MYPIPFLLCASDGGGTWHRSVELAPTRSRRAKAASDGEIALRWAPLGAPSSGSMDATVPPQVSCHPGAGTDQVPSTQIMPLPRSSQGVSHMESARCRDQHVDPAKRKSRDSCNEKEGEKNTVLERDHPCKSSHSIPKSGWPSYQSSTRLGHLHGLRLAKG
ncbi:hypothetical protein V8C40DRAFT_124798 [Trichoderma camerunense]